MYTHQIVTESVINKAKLEAYQAAAKVLDEDKSGSNGSEAWQAVVIKTKNLRKLQNELKSLGIEKDYYWGYTVSPEGLNNYFAEEAWTNTFAKVMTENGITSYRVERLL